MRNKKIFNFYPMIHSLKKLNTRDKNLKKKSSKLHDNMTMHWLDDHLINGQLKNKNKSKNIHSWFCPKNPRTIKLLLDFLFTRTDQ